jgi:hypothetical protein
MQIPLQDAEKMGACKQRIHLRKKSKWIPSIKNASIPKKRPFAFPY